MVDTVSKTKRSEIMGKVRGKDTRPEMVIRKLVHAMGFRYRLHHKGLPGTPDLVFGPKRKVIFVHGCFWHRHSGCKLARLPKTRTDFWTNKLEGNKERDVRNQHRLEDSGWKVLTIWECELGDIEGVRGKIRLFLSGDDKC